jgi:hypothetical protein
VVLVLQEIQVVSVTRNERLLGVARCSAPAGACNLKAHCGSGLLRALNAAALKGREHAQVARSKRNSRGSQNLEHLSLFS